MAISIERLHTFILGISSAYKLIKRLSFPGELWEWGVCGGSKGMGIHIRFTHKIKQSQTHPLGSLLLNLQDNDSYRQLLRLTRRGADPFNFKFVEHYQVLDSGLKQQMRI